MLSLVKSWEESVMISGHVRPISFDAFHTSTHVQARKHPLTISELASYWPSTLFERVKNVEQHKKTGKPVL